MLELKGRGIQRPPLSRKRRTRCSLYLTCPPLVGCSGLLGTAGRGVPNRILTKHPFAPSNNLRQVRLVDP